jgi:SAM-dependent methyltransferase
MDRRAPHTPYGKGGPPVFSESARLYDLIYHQFKDYGEEAATLAATIRDRCPEAREILDVACGTGEHARHLAELGFRVDGVDIEASLVEIATAKNPEGTFVRADMTDFDLGRRYDAVLCLFSSIGYVKSVANLHRATECLARHVRPGGVIVVEPSFQPGDLTDGKVFMQTAQEEEMHVCRMSHTRIRGKVAHMRFEYLVGDADGVRRAAENHELAIFTREEMEEAFRRVDLEVDYDPEGIFGRGLYVGRPRG